MARRPRLDMAGFHHIVNRGVAKDNVYRCDEDKEKYLKILCEACKTYEEHFGDFKSKEERNISVIEALDDGYGQAEVGRYLKITASAIAKVRKKFE